MSLSGSGAVCWSFIDILRCAMLLSGSFPARQIGFAHEEETANGELGRPWMREEIELDMRDEVRYV